MTTSGEFLELLLEGVTPTAADIDKLIEQRVKEDLHLDYKAGSLMQDKKKASATVREWVTAFANAEGGTLIIGVTEPQSTGALRRVDGCRPIGETPLDAWAGNVLTEVGPFLSPPPRIYEIAHSCGVVLIIAVARAPRLVPWTDRGQLAYSFRFHDETIRAPPYLIADLALGRRSHPTLDLRLVECTATRNEWPEGTGFTNLFALQFMLEVENLSLVSAKNTHVVLLGWSVGNMGAFRSRLQQFRMHVDATEPRWVLGAVGTLEQFPFVLQHVGTMLGAKTVDIDPFAYRHLRLHGNIQVPIPTKGQARASCVVCVLPEWSPPQWFELGFTYNAKFNAKFSEAHPMQLIRVETGRPRVKLELI